MSDFTFLDLFAGIGGFRLGAQANGGKALGFSEINAPAIKTYEANFGKNDIALGDLSKVNELPYADLIMGGVPCQSWSTAGVKKGFDDPRGKLWFDAISHVRKTQPKAFIFENVKGLADPRNKECLDLIVNELSSAGYHVQHKLLNAHDFGLPQDRVRLFIVGVRKDLGEWFTFPEPVAEHKPLSAYLSGTKTSEVPPARTHYIFSDIRGSKDEVIRSWDIMPATEFERLILESIKENRRKTIFGSNNGGNPLSLTDIQSFLPQVSFSDLDALVYKGFLRRVGEGLYDFRFARQSSGINGVYRIYLPSATHYPTLTATGNLDFVANYDVANKAELLELFAKGDFRALTVDEASAIQGFPTGFKHHSSRTSAFKQIGNSVPPPVVNAIIGQLKSHLG